MRRTTRRADPDIKSAQSMEKVGFIRGINNPFMKAAGYKRVGMDGCCAILKAAEGAGYCGQGDGWHCTKCKAKHFGTSAHPISPTRPKPAFPHIHVHHHAAAYRKRQG
jgi:hypothetical protein